MTNLATNFAESIRENRAIWFNPDHFGVTVTQYPLGRREDKVEGIVAVWKEEARSDENRGREVIRTGTLLVPDELSVDARDRWVVKGQEWSCQFWKDAGGGLWEVTVQRNEREIRNGGGGKLI